MAFAQSSGPPASARQIQELGELLNTVGYADFREARHPFDLTQRQANGKFTRTEAEELAALLEAEAHPPPDAAVSTDCGGTGEGAARSPSTETGRIDKRLAAQAKKLERVPDEVLAAELQRRGWVVMEP